MASSLSATAAASQRTESLPFRLLSWCLHFKEAAAEEKRFERENCGGRKALLRAEEDLDSVKGEEEGREASEAVVLLSTGAIAIE